MGFKTLPLLALLGMTGACTHTEPPQQVGTTGPSLSSTGQPLPNPPDTSGFSDYSVTLNFFSMGTLWQVRFEDKDAPALAAAQATTTGKWTDLKRRVNQILTRYDQVFSDWSSESELSLLIKKDLHEYQEVSELFYEGMLYAVEAYRMTQRIFDVTVGGVLAGKLSHAVGLDGFLHKRDGTSQRPLIRFAEHPQNMTFGGIAKGMCVGEILNALWHELKPAKILVNAGGGNLAYADGEGDVTFESRSAEFQRGKRHIIHPQGSSTEHLNTKFISKNSLKPEKRATIRCHVALTTRAELVRWGALSDALSTAWVVSSHTQTLPKPCALMLP